MLFSVSLVQRNAFDRGHTHEIVKDLPCKSSLEVFVVDHDHVLDPLEVVGVAHFHQGTTCWIPDRHSPAHRIHSFDCEVASINIARYNVGEMEAMGGCVVISMISVLVAAELLPRTEHRVAVVAQHLWFGILAGFFIFLIN